MKTAKAIAVSEEQQAMLKRMLRSQTIDVRAARRARIVLLAGEGMGDREIARQLGIGRIQAARWRARFAEGGVDAIRADLPRSGRKPRIDAADIVRVTTQTKPAGATHWSTRKLAAKLGVSDTTVLKVWRANGLKPHLVESFKVSRDPKFIEKLEDIVGLYMSPPEHALVLCCDEKSQVQALDRTQPGLPLKIRPGRNDDARLQAPWHDNTVRCHEHAQRQGYFLLRPAPSPHRMDGLPAPDQP